MDEGTLRTLQALDALVQQNPLVAYNNPDLGPLHKKQIAFHDGAQRVRVYIGGNRAGKSTAGVVDSIIQALDREAVPEHLLKYKRCEPPFYWRIVTPDFTRTMSAVLEAFRKWVPPYQLRGGSWERAWDKQQRIVHFANKSFVECLTYEQDVDKFGGSARHRIHYDEEPPGDKGELIRKECQMRLVDYRGDEIFTFTPLLGLGWTFDDLWRNRGPEIDPQVWSDDSSLLVRAAMFDNPHVPTDDDNLKGLTKEEYRARVLGEFVHFKGLVYPEFDYETHVVDPPNINHIRKLDVIEGIDPGVRTTGIVFCAFDRDNHMLVFDELYLHDEAAIPENAAQHIKAKRKGWGYSPAWTVIDPSARNRSLVNAENVEAAYQRAGIQTMPGQNEVEAGVFEVKRRLQARPPALLVSKACQKLLWERDSYRADEKADGSFTVVKRDDHLMDPLRYVAMSRPWWQDAPAARPRRPAFGEPGYREPRYRPSPPVESSPMGSLT